MCWCAAVHTPYASTHQNRTINFELNEEYLLYILFVNKIVIYLAWGVNHSVEITTIRACHAHSILCWFGDWTMTVFNHTHASTTHLIEKQIWKKKKLIIKNCLVIVIEATEKVLNVRQQCALHRHTHTHTHPTILTSWKNTKSNECVIDDSTLQMDALRIRWNGKSNIFNWTRIDWNFVCQ